MTLTRIERLGRGVLVASGATFVALFSHVLGGGDMPGWLGIVIPWILSATVGTLLAGRRLPVVRLSLSVILSQLLFHALFVLGAGSAVVSSASAGAGHARHVDGSTVAVTVTPTVEHFHGGTSMWVWHAVAAVLTIVLIRRADATLSSIKSAMRPLRVRLAGSLTLLALTDVPALSRRLGETGHTLTCLRSALICAALPLRGPPLFSI